MTYTIGIDGGGSTVRVVVVSPVLEVLGQAQYPSTVNPNVIGRTAAAQTIQNAVADALKNSGVSSKEISAVGIGIAGALTGELRDWMRSVIHAVTPDAYVSASSDAETALVGAHAERRGVLVISGTGSVAYGINSAGHSTLVGGWGYLAGDEGSGYWIGMAALKAATLADDGRGPRTALTDAVLQMDYLRDREHIVQWLYQDGHSRTRDIAKLVPVVLEHAKAGDLIAQKIVETAARDLALHVRAVIQNLGMEKLPVAFAGGVLSEPNPVSSLLCELLGLVDFPVTRYPPVVGAALLAMLLKSETRE